MTIELSQGEVQILLESLQYSKQHVGDAQNTPQSVKRENLKRLEDVIAKLQLAKNAG